MVKSEVRFSVSLFWSCVFATEGLFFTHTCLPPMTSNKMPIQKLKV